MMPANQYGKKIPIKDAIKQNKLRNSLKLELAKEGTINMENIDVGLHNEAQQLFINGKNLKGFVFERSLIQRFFESPFWAEYLIVFEACSIEGKDIGKPAVSILPVKFVNTNEAGQDIFEIVDAVDVDNDATEHPGTPIINGEKKIKGNFQLVIGEEKK